MCCNTFTSNLQNLINREVIRMKTEKREVQYLCSQITDLKARCKELSQENLLLKTEIADLRMTNVLLGGAL